MPYGLKEIELAKLSKVFASNEHIKRVILYGSRAKGNYKLFSDVDITLEGPELTFTDLNHLSLAIDDLLLPYQFDISIFHTLKNHDLIDHIQRIGITIFERESEWKEYKLGDIADITPGFAFKSKDFGQTGELVVKIKDIAPPYIELANADHVDLSSYDKNKLSKYLLCEGDYVVAMTGATIGKVGKLKTDKYAYLNQRVAKIKAKEGVCDDFVYFSICGDDFQSFIQNNIDSNSAQENISANSIGRFPVSLPSLNEQRRIASILSSLDDKIDLLHRENATLEQMAETLFRQWFVVEAKEEWEEGKLGDLIEVKYGKDHKKLLDGKIPVIGSGGIMRYADTALYDKESVLIPRKGSLNNVMYMNEPFWTVDTMFYTEMRRPNIAKFVFHFMKCQDLANMNVGSAVPSMTTEVLNNIPIDIPPQEVFDRFENAVASLYNKKEQNNKQIQTLIQTRDGLLPRLMNNEITIEV